jgi:hypothetical protein
MRSEQFAMRMTRECGFTRPTSGPEMHNRLGGTCTSSGVPFIDGHPDALTSDRGVSNLKPDTVEPPS